VSPRDALQCISALLPTERLQIMENSPLELYDKAYRLHYVENNVVQAGQLYEALIKEFPESNECGYAVIQLQKIHAREVVDSIEALRRKGHPLLLVSVVLNIVTLLAVVAVAVLFLTDQRAPASGLSAAAPTSSAVVPPPPPPPPVEPAPVADDAAIVESGSEPIAAVVKEEKKDSTPARKRAAPAPAARPRKSSSSPAKDSVQYF